MLPERMRARRAPSSGETGGTTIVATHDPIAAGPNAGTRITTRHVNPTPPAAFTLNSAKASTVLLCCCGARVCKGYNREKADGRQIAHCICPSVDCLRYPHGERGHRCFRLALSPADSFFLRASTEHAAQLPDALRVIGHPHAVFGHKSRSAIAGCATTCVRGCAAVQAVF